MRDLWHDNETLKAIRPDNFKETFFDYLIRLLTKG